MTFPINNFRTLSIFFAKNYLLIIILVLASILRLNKLGVLPPSLNWDEAALGYNAYSILKTQKDEYANKLPLYFRSLDDYKPPLYTYLTVPAVGIFGLNDFAVRLPSALLGILTVFSTYLLAKELFKNKKIAYLSSFFLAISPWHLQFSRVAFETNTTIFWFTLGLWAFLRGIGSKGIKVTLFMTLSALAFGANLYTYHNVRLFIPLFCVFLILVFRRQLLHIKKHLILPAIIAAIVVITLLPILTSTAGKMRYEGTNIFSDKTPLDIASLKISQDAKNNFLLPAKLIHNRRLAYIPVFIGNYLSHLNPKYLFFTADMDRHHAPQIGLLLLWDLPFLLFGLYLLLAKNFNRKSKYIIITWFLLAPVASALTWGVPHSLRSEIFLPTYQIFTSIGVLGIYNLIKFKKFFIIIVTFFLTINFFYYLHEYYFHLAPEFSKSWLYGRKEAAIYTNLVKDKYDHVIVSTKLEQPHIFWLYYLKYDPKKYQKEGGTVSGGFLEDKNKFDKFLFKPIDYESQRNQGKILFVGVPSDFPKEIHPLKIINYLNNEPAIYIIGNN